MLLPESAHHKPCSQYHHTPFSSPKAASLLKMRDLVSTTSEKKMCFYNDNCRIHWLTTQKSTQSNHLFSSLTMKSTKVQDWFQVPNWDLAWQKGSQYTRRVLVSIWWRLRKLINFSKSILKYCESRSLWFPNCNNSKTILLGSYTTFTWNQFTIVTSSNTNMYIL